MPHRLNFKPAASLLLGGLLLFSPLQSAGESPPPTPECVTYRAHAKGSIGYDHLVVVTNSCAVVARCDVSTDVNPSPVRIELSPGATETVLTFRGSPAREFTPRVMCTLARS